MEMKNSGLVLFVPNREEWEVKFENYMRARKRAMSWVGGVFGILLIVATAYLAAMLYPLITGDIAFGNPRYYDYRTGSDVALILVILALFLYCGGTIMLNRWVRKTNVVLGLNPEGTIADVREAITPSTTVEAGAID